MSWENYIPKPNKILTIEPCSSKFTENVNLEKRGGVKECKLFDKGCKIGQREQRGRRGQTCANEGN